MVAKAEQIVVADRCWRNYISGKSIPTVESVYKRPSTQHVFSEPLFDEKLDSSFNTTLLAGQRAFRLRVFAEYQRGGKA